MTKERSVGFGTLLLSSDSGSEYPPYSSVIPSHNWIYDSLKNHGADLEVEGMFEMGAETMNLLLEEKMKFEQGDDGQSFGFVQTFF